MKVLANRLELLAICKRASHIASSLSPVEELRGILLEANKAEQMLTATVTNFELSLRCTMKATVKEGGAWVVNAKTLTGMLTLLQGEQVGIHGRENATMLIAGGTCRYLISVLPGRRYPKTEIPFPEDTVQVTGIPALARRTVFAVSDNEATPIMRCVNLAFSQDGLRAVGSDGSRVMSVKGDAKSAGAVSLLVPARSIATLAGMVNDSDSLLVGTTGQAVVFMREGLVFSARLVSGSYINTDGLLQSITPLFTVLTDGEALGRALDTVAVVADVGEKLCFDFQGGAIHLSCTYADGSAKGSLEVIPLSGTPTGSYYYPAKKLIENLRVLSGTLKLQVAANGLLLMENEQASCLQTALRAPSTQETAKKKPPKAA